MTIEPSYVISGVGAAGSLVTMYFFAKGDARWVSKKAHDKAIAELNERLTKAEDKSDGRANANSSRYEMILREVGELKGTLETLISMLQR